MYPDQVVRMVDQIIELKTGYQMFLASWHTCGRISLHGLCRGRSHRDLFILDAVQVPAPLVECLKHGAGALIKLRRSYGLEYKTIDYNGSYRRLISGDSL